MASKIILKKSSVQGKIPQSADLEFGELALNYADGKLYFKNSSNSITSIVSGSSYTKITSNTTAESGTKYIADTSAGSFTLTLPSSPSAGSNVTVNDGGSFYTHNLIVARNGSTIEGISDDLTVNIGGIQLTLVYDGTTWQVYTELGAGGGNAVTLSGSQTFTNKTISGSANTLTNIPDSAITALSYSKLTGAPTLFSGSYTDLTNKPTIPSLTGYATESYVTTAISNVIGAAPAALDTLKEIADQLAADESAVTSLTTTVAGKVSLTGSYANPDWITSLAGSKVTNAVLTTDTGTVTNTMLAGSIANSKLTNSSVTINGTSISLGASATVTAAAGTLTGTTLNSTVVSSSLTSLGTLGSLTVTNNATVNGQVVTPNRTGFRVIGSGTTNNLGITVNTHGALTGNNFTVDFQQGTALNTTSGVFTAPTAGLYQVNIVVRNSGYTSGIMQAGVVKNAAGGNGAGGTVVVMVEFAASSTMNHAGGSSVVKMAANDTLALKVLAGQINFDQNDNWSVAFLG